MSAQELCVWTRAERKCHGVITYSSFDLTTRASSRGECQSAPRPTFSPVSQKMWISRKSFRGPPSGYTSTARADFREW
jgi:hypothetical protein